MKKNIFSLLALVTVLGSSLLVLDGCKLKNPMEGVKILIKSDFVTAPSEFRIVDSKYGYAPGFTSPVPVSVTGPGAAYVFSSGGNKTLSIFQGGINLSIRKGAVVSETNPLKFNLVINAPGYLPLIYPVTLYSLNPVTQSISLVSFNNPPAGSNNKTQIISTDGSGSTTAASTIAMDTSNGSTDKISITIDAGTKMTDISGNAVSGNVEAKILHFTNKADESISAFPGGTNVISTKSTTGATLPGGTFEPAGWVNIEMSVGGTAVKTFSKPIKINMEISGLNPKTNVDYKEGDVIETYSRSVGESEWVKESDVTILKNTSSGKLEVPILASHLSAWQAGYLLSPCGEFFRFYIVIPASSNTTSGRAAVYFKKNNLDRREYLWVQSLTFPTSSASRIELVTTTFKPAADIEYYFETSQDFPFLFHGKLCSTSMNIGQAKPSQKLEIYIFLKCANGNQVLLPNGYKIYFIDDAIYQNTTVPAKGNNPAHKIDPRDGIFISGNDTAKWSEGYLGYSGGTKPLNYLTLLKLEDLKIGSKYRFSVYYNDGKTESREDFVTETITQEVLEKNSMDMTIPLSRCPL